MHDKPSSEGEMTETGRRLRLLSYNVQVGIRSTTPRHYLTKSWKNLLPAARRLDNLRHIGRLLHDYDIVGLQELDSGSHRTGFVNLSEFLAEQAHFPFWHHQINRNLGRIAQHGHALLSRIQPDAVEEYPLPGLIPGRGALMMRFGHGDNALAVMMVHLALSRRARCRQLGFVAERLADFRHAVLMGDMNSEPGSPEMRTLFSRSELREPEQAMSTFPSWRPQRSIDHILVTPQLEVEACQVLPERYSDHLPIAMQLRLPSGVLGG